MDWIFNNLHPVLKYYTYTTNFNNDHYSHPSVWEEVNELKKSQSKITKSMSVDVIYIVIINVCNEANIR